MASTVTLAATVADSHVELMTQYFILAFLNTLIFAPGSELISFENSINGKSVDIVDYNTLAPTVTPLVDGTDAETTNLTDNSITLTPVEYGLAVAKTKLASLQTGGSVDKGAALVVARNAAESMNLIALNALKATTNSLIANSAASEAALVAGDVIQPSDIAYIHNRLSRANVPKLKGGSYVAIAHPDILGDIKDSADWKSVEDYGAHVNLLNHEVGKYKGFRWLETASNEPTADAGASAVDSYDTIFMGAGGLAHTVSHAIRMILSMGTDPLQRKLNVGWYGVFNYALVKNTSIWTATSASAYGANT